MQNEVITYKNVFERTFPKTFTFGTFIHNPEDIFIAYERFDYQEQLERIKNIKNKEAQLVTISKLVNPITPVGALYIFVVTNNRRKQPRHGKS